MNKNQRNYYSWVIVFLALFIFSYNANLLAQTPSSWGNLKPGPYSIGFKTIEKYDYSRVFRPKYDYFGNELPGERARPIQVCLWYPAKDDNSSTEMTYAEYVYPYPNDDGFINLLSSLQNREINYLHYISRGNHGYVLDLMSAKMAAVKNAVGLDGPFPLLIYHPDRSRSYCENAVMCEYLASNGFVFAAAHSLGMSSVNFEENPANLEAQIRDKEFAVSCLKDHSYINHNKIGTLGYSQGGMAALIMQMRNTDVEAAASLEGWFVINERIELAMQFPSFNINRMAVPLLQISGQQDEHINFALFDSLIYSDRYSLQLKDFHGTDFTHYSMFSVIASDSVKTLMEPKRRGYEIICRYVLNHFKAKLERDENSIEFLKNSPKDNGFEPELITFNSFARQELPPTSEQFVGIVRQGKITEAVEIYEKFKKTAPNRIIFREATFNALGYQFIQTGRTEAAIEIFKMNADAYPRSANTWDSLAEACMANGDNEFAIKYYRKALETLESDTTTTEDLKELIRNGARQNIERLGG